MRAGVVWLSQTWPIKRRWRLRVRGRVVISIPMRTVQWSRDTPPPDAP